MTDVLVRYSKVFMRGAFKSQKNQMFFHGFWRRHLPTFSASLLKGGSPGIEVQLETLAWIWE